VVDDDDDDQKERSARWMGTNDRGVSTQRGAEKGSDPRMTDPLCVSPLGRRRVSGETSCIHSLTACMHVPAHTTDVQGQRSHGQLQQLGFGASKLSSSTTTTYTRSISIASKFIYSIGRFPIRDAHPIRIQPQSPGAREPAYIPTVSSSFALQKIARIASTSPQNGPLGTSGSG
jgi:hypothetical protein